MSQKVKECSENDMYMSKGHRNHPGEDSSSSKHSLILIRTVNILFLNYINKIYFTNMPTVNVKVYSKAFYT